MAAYVKNVVSESGSSTDSTPSSTWQLDLSPSRTKIAVAAAAAGVVSAGVVWYLYRKKRRIRPDADIIELSSKPIAGGSQLDFMDGGATGDKTTLQKDSIVTQKQEELGPYEIAQHLKSQGNSLFKEGEYAKAISRYTEAIEKCPTDNAPWPKEDLATFYQNRAAAYEKLHDFEKVIEDCDKALEYNERYVKALFRRGKAFEQMDKLQESLQDMTAVCILDTFSNRQYLEKADRILKQIAKEKAATAFKNWDYILPSNSHIYNFLSSFIEDPALERAAKLFNDGDNDAEVKMNGTQHLSSYEEALLCLKSRQYEDVLGLCDKELATESKVLGEAGVAGGDGDSGVVVAGSADPTTEATDAWRHREARLLRATFHLLMGKMTEAIEELDDLISDTTTTSGGGGSYDTADAVRCSALLKKSTALLQCNRHEEAFALADQAVREYAHLPDVYHYRGQLNLLLENLDQSIEDFTRAADMRPQYPIAQVQKCFAKYRSAVSQESPSAQAAVTAEFEGLCAAFPHCSEAHLLYAQIPANHAQAHAPHQITSDSHAHPRTHPPHTI